MCLNALPSNKRLQLTLPPIGDRLFAVLRGVVLAAGEGMLVAFVLLTPARRWGAAETRVRSTGCA